MFRICLLFLSLSMVLKGHLEGFDKVVLWGHKLHSHTHSYIHNAFIRAFTKLGYQTYWFDDNDDVSEFDFANSLFITEGQVDKNIPLRMDCKYILHNCDQNRYRSQLENGCAIILQVYTDHVLERNTIEIAKCIHYDIPGKIVYMPWATDLLPEEIENMKQTIRNVKKEKVIYWIGTVGGGVFGNTSELQPFIEAAETSGIPFVHYGNVSISQNRKLIAKSYIAPAIVGEYQKEVGYIPCRIFKNISYGQMGVTNSYRVYELLEKKIVYNSDTHQLFYDAKKRIKNLTQKELFELMDLVKEKHTYLNRIHTLLDFLNIVSEQCTQTGYR